MASKAKQSTQETIDSPVYRRQLAMPLVRTSGEYNRQADQHKHDHVHLQPSAGVDPIHRHIQEEEGHHVLEDIDRH